MKTLNEILPKSARPKPESKLGQVVATQRGWELIHDRNGYCELLNESPRLYDTLIEAGFDQFGQPVSGSKSEDSGEEPMTREALSKMEFSALKALAVENEISEKSREKIVNELCSLFGLE